MILNFDVRVVFSKDEDYSANLIEKIYRMKNLDYTLNFSKREKIYHATNFFGISKQKLSLLYGHFQSIRNMVNADKKEFTRIKGLGKKSVDKLNNVMDSSIFEL